MGHAKEPSTPSERDLLERCVCNQVRRAARAITRAYDAALRPTGLRATQMSVLVAVAAADGQLSISALAESMAMDRSTLTRNLQPLASQGLVSLGAEGWRRSKTVAITRKGLERMRKALPCWEQAQRSLHDALGGTAWNEVTRGLERLGRLV
jgi:DNA-binding MarR family transcriptional regulator